MTILTPLPGRRFRVYTRPRGEDDDFVAAALGVKSLAVLAIRPDRHAGLFAEPASLAAVERYASLVSGR